MRVDRGLGPLMAIAALLSACDAPGLPIGVRGDGGAPPPPPHDMTVMYQIFDLPFIPRGDIGGLPGGSGQTGDPCTRNTDCRNSNFAGSNRGVCTKITFRSSGSITWPGGYCQSPCRPNKNAMDGTNPDCPGDTAICAGAGTTGQCVVGCTQVSDCRDGYVCAYAFAGVTTAGCLPLADSECDPPMDPRPSMKPCPPNNVCVSYSPDNSYGGCALKCDPVLQGCPQPMLGNAGCVVDLKSTDGSGECFDTNGVAEGGACKYLNDCQAGMMCNGGVCRYYCRKGGANGGLMNGLCPMGQTCDDIKLGGVMVKFHSDTTGICHP
jgi:hypothetical protein